MDELVYRHQFDGGHSQAFQVINGRLVGEAGVRPSQLGWDSRVFDGEPLDVDLVDDRLMPGSAGRAVMDPAKNGSTTTDLGTDPALSWSSRLSGSP